MLSGLGELEVVSLEGEPPLPTSSGSLSSYPTSAVPKIPSQLQTGKPGADHYRYQPVAISAHPEAFKAKTFNYSHALQVAEPGVALERMKRVRSIEDLGKCDERTRRVCCCEIEGCTIADKMNVTAGKKSEGIGSV